jgi:hypothetical protein
MEDCGGVFFFSNHDGQFVKHGSTVVFVADFGLPPRSAIYKTDI